ncbi:winged helix-turn-helix domain-containing protein [Lysinibacillus fusiformis]|uniref:winged helix-turn-helix domain-containing protein n=1 Tax=Lysinibacillus fusiformis TaxID=28031 RepID=UPI003CFDA4F9
MPAAESARDWIYRVLRERILEGAAGFRPGDRLPTRGIIADAFKVSPATVGRAIDLLKHDGLVKTSGGAGTVVVVTEAPPDYLPEA